MSQINKIIKLINNMEETIETYDDRQLRDKTDEFKNQIRQGKSINDILPEAFAIVREAVKRITGKRLHDVQLMGGYILNQGKIAEIKAGEGKTLTASLPAYINALTGNGVHIITTNEYLAKRDSNEVGQVLEFLGLTVGLIYQNMESNKRKEAYQKDVTYGTNTEFGFDYLRDNMSLDYDAIVQRELNYAIIDEADSILIDEAQTPMIISKKELKTEQEPYIKANNFVEKLKGRTIIKEEPKNEEQLRENEKYDYVVDETFKTVELTQKGIHKAEEEYKLKNYYDKNNIEIINLVRQALRAKAIMQKDVDYIVNGGKVLLIDKYTGRIMYGKKYTNGLHEAIQAKEHIAIDESSKIMASISTQNYFKLYKKISGMTGTAEISKKEFNEVYNTEVIKVPTNKKTKRIDKPDQIYFTKEEKYKAIISEIKKSTKVGQPILIGTTSIEESEKLGKLLSKENIEHNILNAKKHKEEAEIIKQAGKLNAVTISTNMAGRGTNILLGGESGEKEKRKQVLDVGGLKVIGTEKHESRRIDEQLRGRSGRQGNIGESIFIVSREDELYKIYGNKNILGKNNIKKEMIKAQKRAENRNYSARKRTLYYDEVLNIQRKIIFSDRREILKGETENIAKRFIEYFIIQIFRNNNERNTKIINKISKAENIDQDSINMDTINKKICDRYERKKNAIGREKFVQSEKNKLLNIIDENWVNYLENMDELKLNIELRAYGKHNPIEEYRKEGKKRFDNLVKTIKMDFVCQLLFNENYEI